MNHFPKIIITKTNKTLNANNHPIQLSFRTKAMFPSLSTEVFIGLVPSSCCTTCMPKTHLYLCAILFKQLFFIGNEKILLIKKKKKQPEYIRDVLWGQKT